MRRRPGPCAPILSLLLATLPGCGAGVITAAVAGSGGGGGTQVETSITLSEPVGPLSVEAGEVYVRRAVLRGRRLPADADVEVWLRATQPAAEDQQTLLVVERDGDETTLTFALRTDTIAVATGDVHARDVLATIVVLVRREDDSAEELFETPFRLLRKPLLTLMPNDPSLGISVVAATGGELAFATTALPTRDVRDLVVEVVTEDPDPPPGTDPTRPAPLLRRASNLRAEADPLDPELTIVRCTAPPWAFPTPAFARVVHTGAGRSNLVAGIYYRPELTSVVPRRGSTDGSELVTLNGQALVPLDFTSRPARPSFPSLRLFVAKGGREVEVPSADLRTSLSSLNALVFVTPPSPDGQPGPAAVRLRVFLPQPVDVAVGGLFAYGAPVPDLGPRGVGLGEQDVVATAFGARTSGGLLDVASVAADAGGVPVVRVLTSRGNGMFARAGVPIEAAFRGDPTQQGPVDLAFGEFHGDGLGDVLVVNRGSARAAHTVLQGTSDPSRPLRLQTIGFRTTPVPVRVHAGRLDDDQRDDVLVVGATDAERSTEYAIATGAGTFTSRLLFPSPVPRVDASTIADLDGDGHADLAFVNGGPGATLRLAFGEPGELFQDRRNVDLGPLPSLANATVSGLHAIGPGPDRALCLVLRPGGGAEPTLELFVPSAARHYDVAPLSIGLGNAGGLPSASLAHDLDADGTPELLLARELAGLSLWAWQGGTLVERVSAVEFDAARLGAVRALGAGAAVDPAHGARLGVFVAHDDPTAAPAGPRVTTLLVEPGPRLADPLARVPLAVRARGAALCQFVPAAPSRPAQDVAVASVGQLDVLVNDGVGELAAAQTIAVPGLVPETLHALRVGGTLVSQELVLLTEDGRVGVLAAGAAAPVLSPQPLFDGAGTVLPATRLATGDVDGDGFEDLVVLLVVERPAAPPAERTLLLLRGRDPAVHPFPLIVPNATARTSLSALACDVALGDLAPDAAVRRLEAVVAVPRDDPERGLHFFRLEPGAGEADWALVPSVIDPSDGRLAAAFDVRLVLAADLEGDGGADLVVVSGTRDVVQVLRHTGGTGRVVGEVDPLQFAATPEQVLPAGTPVAAHLADADGDGFEDVVVQVRSRDDPGAHAIAVAMSSGVASFASGFEIAAGHVGRAGPELSTASGDLNSDGVPDLLLVWSGDGGTLEGHLRVLFGSHR